MAGAVGYRIHGEAQGVDVEKAKMSMRIQRAYCNYVNYDDKIS